MSVLIRASNLRVLQQLQSSKYERHLILWQLERAMTLLQRTILFCGLSFSSRNSPSNKHTNHNKRPELSAIPSWTRNLLYRRSPLFEQRTANSKHKTKKERLRLLFNSWAFPLAPSTCSNQFLIYYLYFDSFARNQQKEGNHCAKAKVWVNIFLSYWLLLLMTPYKCLSYRLLLLVIICDPRQGQGINASTFNCKVTPTTRFHIHACCARTDHHYSSKNTYQQFLGCARFHISIRDD